LWLAVRPPFQAPNESYPQIFTQTRRAVEKSSSFCGKLIECSPICNVQHSSGIAHSKSNPIGVSLAEICNNRGSGDLYPQILALTLD
jgi:hypothetical protein